MNNGEDIAGIHDPANQLPAGVTVDKLAIPLSLTLEELTQLAQGLLDDLTIAQGAGDFATSSIINKRLMQFHAAIEAVHAYDARLDALEQADEEEEEEVFESELLPEDADIPEEALTDALVEAEEEVDNRRRTRRDNLPAEEAG